VTPPVQQGKVSRAASERVRPSEPAAIVLYRAFQKQHNQALGGAVADGRRLASRFVAGTTIEDALWRASGATRRIAVSLDSLGESVTVELRPARTKIYTQVLDAIAAKK